MNIFNSHAGHGKQDSKSCGAMGVVNESVENRKLNTEFINIMKTEGKIVYDCTVDYPASGGDCLNKIISKCNSHKVNLDISHHLNSGRKDPSGDGSIGGVEVIVYDTKGASYPVAQRICKELEKLGFKNRGVKVNPDLAVLRDTNAQALIIEYFFVDDKDDCNLYKKLGYKVIAKTVAQAVLNKTIEDKTIYKIVTGGFGAKENAEKKMNAIKELTGWWMTTEKINSKEDYRIVTGGMSKVNAEKNLESLKQLTNWWAVVEKQ